MTEDLLARIDAYLDAVVRPATRAEEIGPFTLFINEGKGWPYYARPTIGARGFAERDVRAVRARQRELGIPEAFEWVVQTAPGASEAIAAGGLAVTHRPLMVAGPTPAAGVVDIRPVQPEDDLALMIAVQNIGFAAPGTASGSVGTEALALAAEGVDPAHVDTTRRRLREGRSVAMAVWVDDLPVAAGMHQPVGAASEVVGVATLPAFRRRGFGGALTAALVRDARSRGVDLVLLSAGDATVARVYERSGFTTIGEFADAEPASG